jgi:hypothetical protein
MEKGLIAGYGIESSNNPSLYHKNATLLKR